MTFSLAKLKVLCLLCKVVLSFMLNAKVIRAIILSAIIPIALY
jgi:hypothetical protein